MPISHKDNCIFIHIPKTAGTSIEAALDIHAKPSQENRQILFGRILSPDLKQHRFLARHLQHLTMLDVRKILGEKKCRRYFSFSFVRNPWDRLVSFYHYVFQRRDWDIINIAASKGRRFSPKTSFSEFVHLT